VGCQQHPLFIHSDCVIPKYPQSERPLADDLSGQIKAKEITGNAKKNSKMLFFIIKYTILYLNSWL
jgi:hypothetical protein